MFDEAIDRTDGASYNLDFLRNQNNQIRHYCQSQKNYENRQNFNLVKSLSMQIKNPIQILAEILKMIIKLYQIQFEKQEVHEPTKIVINQDEFKPLDVNINLCQMQ